MAPELTMTELTMQQRLLAYELTHSPEKWFRRSDKDGDGALSKMEAREALLKAEVPFMAQWDLDGDGAVSLQEFFLDGGMRQGIFAALGLELPGSEANAGSSTPRTPRRQDDDWRTDLTLAAYLDEGQGAPTPRAGRADDEWIDELDGSSHRETLELPGKLQDAWNPLPPHCFGKMSEEAMGSGSNHESSTDGDLANVEDSLSHGEEASSWGTLACAAPFEKSHSRCGGSEVVGDPPVTSSSFSSDSGEQEHADEPPLKEPVELFCLVLEKSETEIERLERVVSYVLEQLPLEGVQLPDNIAREEHARVPVHSSGHVYRFGTRRLHLSVREAEGGKLLLICRTGGGFSDFADYCRRHGRLELSRWRGLPAGLRSTSNPRLSRVESSASTPSDEKARRNTDPVLLASILGSSTPRAVQRASTPRGTRGAPRCATPRAVHRELTPPRAVQRELTPPRAVQRELTPPQAVKREPLTPRASVKQESLTPRASVKREPLTPRASVKRQPLTPRASVKRESLTPRAAVKQEPLTVRAAVKREALTPRGPARRSMPADGKCELTPRGPARRSMPAVTATSMSGSFQR